MKLEAVWPVQNADPVSTCKVRVIRILGTLIKIQYVALANRGNSAIMNGTNGASIAPREPTATQERRLALLVTQALLLPISDQGRVRRVQKIPTNRIMAQAAVFPVMHVTLAFTEQDVEGSMQETACSAKSAAQDIPRFTNVSLNGMGG
jgi:hypothetical protein